MSGQTKFGDILEALGAIRRTLREQDERWARAKSELQAAGEVEFAVAELPTLQQTTQPPPRGIRG